MFPFTITCNSSAGFVIPLIVVGIQTILSQVTDSFNGILYVIFNVWLVELSIAVLVIFNTATPVVINLVVETV